jgi:hypothetical protein
VKLKQKDSAIRQFEGEMKDSEVGVLKNVSSLKEFKIKEDA